MARAVNILDAAITKRAQDDVRRPSADFPRLLGVAERTVRARIERLFSDKVIRLVAPIVPPPVGYAVTADVFLEVEAGRIQSVASLIAAKPEVGYIGLTTGDRDISLQIHAESVEKLYDFVTKELGTISGVVRTNTFIIPKILKTHFDFVGPGMRIDEESEREADFGPRRIGS